MFEAASCLAALPESLGQLSALQQLDLCRMQQPDCDLPDSLDQLPALQQLNLSMLLAA